MQPSGAAWIEIGMVASGALGLLVLLAPALGGKPKQTGQGWLFPVKLTCLLAYCAGLALGLGAVAYGGYTLLAFANSNWGGWASFAFGFVSVLLVVSRRPASLLFDQDGLLKRGSPDSRISPVGVSRSGKQLMVAEMTYNSSHLLDRLVDRAGSKESSGSPSLP